MNWLGGASKQSADKRRFGRTSRLATSRWRGWHNQCSILIIYKLKQNFHVVRMHFTILRRERRFQWILRVYHQTKPVMMPCHERCGGEANHLSSTAHNRNPSIIIMNAEWVKTPWRNGIGDHQQAGNWQRQKNAHIIWRHLLNIIY